MKDYNMYTKTYTALMFDQNFYPLINKSTRITSEYGPMSQGSKD